MSEPKSSVYSICTVTEMSARSDIRNQARETSAAGGDSVAIEQHISLNKYLEHLTHRCC